MVLHVNLSVDLGMVPGSPYKRPTNRLESMVSGETESTLGSSGNFYLKWDVTSKTWTIRETALRPVCLWRGPSKKDSWTRSDTSPEGPGEVDFTEG